MDWAPIGSLGSGWRPTESPHLPTDQNRAGPAKKQQILQIHVLESLGQKKENNKKSVSSDMAISMMKLKFKILHLSIIITV